MFLILSTAATIVASLVDTLMGLDPVVSTGPVRTLTSLFFFWPSIAVCVKRFHDRGMSGWWIFLPLLAIFVASFVLVFTGALTRGPAGREFNAVSFGTVGIVALAAVGLVALWQFVVLYLMPGQRGDNAYGADPRGGNAPSRSTESSELSQARLAAMQTSRASSSASTGPEGWDFLQGRESTPAAAPAAAFVSPEKKRNALPSENGQWGFGRCHPSRFRPAR